MMAQKQATAAPLEQFDTEKMRETATTLSNLATASPFVIAENLQQQAANTLQIWQLVSFMDTKPRKSDPNRAAYDEIVNTLGKATLTDEKGTPEQALAVLNAQLSRAVERLYNLTVYEKGKPENNIENLDAATKKSVLDMLSSLQDQPDYSPLQFAMEATDAAFRGYDWQREVAPPERETQLVEFTAREPGAVRVIWGTATDATVAVSPVDDPFLNQTLGSRESANGVLTGVANGYATLYNHKNDADRINAASQSLYNALNAINSYYQDLVNQGILTQEDLNSTIVGKDSFKNALMHANRNQLSAALDDLMKDPAFNVIFDAAKGIYVLDVSQRAVVISRAGIMCRHEFEKQNVEEFKMFIAGIKDGTFSPTLLSYAIGLYWEQFLMSGQLRQLGPDAEGTLRTLSKKAVHGKGQAVTIPVEATFGFTLWHKPISTTISSSVIWQKYDLSTKMQLSDGTTQTLGIPEHGDIYLGTTAFDFRFLERKETGPGGKGTKGVEPQRFPWFRLESVKVGVVPQAGLSISEAEGVKEKTSMLGAGYLGGITLSRRWTKEGPLLRMESLVTPQYMYLLQQHFLNFNLRPLDLTFQLNPKWAVFGSPSFTYEHNFTGRTNRLEFGGTATVQYLRGIGLTIGGGYTTERGGEPGRAVPSSGYVSATLDLTPAQFFAGKAKAVPTKTQ